MFTTQDHERTTFFRVCCFSSPVTARKMPNTSTRRVLQMSRHVPTMFPTVVAIPVLCKNSNTDATAATSPGRSADCISNGALTSVSQIEVSVLISGLRMRCHTRKIRSSLQASSEAVFVERVVHPCSCEGDTTLVLNLVHLTLSDDRLDR